VLLIDASKRPTWKGINLQGGFILVKILHRALFCTEIPVFCLSDQPYFGFDESICGCPTWGEALEADGLWAWSQLKSNADLTKDGIRI